MASPSIEEIRKEAIALVEQRRRIERRKIGVLALVLFVLLTALGYAAGSITATTVADVQLVQTLGGLTFLAIMILFALGAYLYQPPSLRLLLTARLAGIELEIRRMLTAQGDATRANAMSLVRRKCETLLQAIPSLPFGKLDLYLDRHRDFVRTITRSIRKIRWFAKKHNASAITESTANALDDLVLGMWATSQHLTDETSQAAHQFLDSLGGALPSRWSIVGEHVTNPPIRDLGLAALFLLIAFGISLAMVLPVAVLLGAPRETVLAPAGAMAAAIFAALYFGLSRRRT